MPYNTPLNPAGVTPHAGVWIETSGFTVGGTITYVTPHAGVWIETVTKMLKIGKS